MRRVEPHQPAGGPPAGEEGPQAAVGEDPLHEVLAEAGVRQPPFLLDRQLRQAGGERRGEQPDAGPRRRAVPVVDLHALHAAARRVLLQHVAAQIGAREPGGAAFGEARHGLGQVPSGLRHHEPQAARRPLEAHRVARRAEPELHLGADRHPLDPLAERVDEEAVPLVPAVEPHGLAQQARRDADADGGLGLVHVIPVYRTAVIMISTSPSGFTRPHPRVTRAGNPFAPKKARYTSFMAPYFDRSVR